MTCSVHIVYRSRHNKYGSEFIIRDFFKWLALCNVNVDCFHVLIVFLTLSITATYLHVMKFYTLKHLATSIGLQVVNLKLSAFVVHLCNVCSTTKSSDSHLAPMYYIVLHDPFIATSYIQ